MTSSAESANMVDGMPSNGQDSLVQPLLTDYYQEIINGRALRRRGWDPRKLSYDPETFLRRRFFVTSLGKTLKKAFPTIGYLKARESFKRVITMCYGYWLAGSHDDIATFDLFFRKNPFKGEYTIFAGLEDCLRFVENFRLSRSDIEYIRTLLPPDSHPDFFDYLAQLDCQKVKIEAVPEGSVVFPKEPLITVEGPLAICQLLETTFLNLINFASLIATNAARFRHVAGGKKKLFEFGLRRAQGPNGGLTASKYCYIGGFDGTSNVLAGKLFGIPVKGTQAHSFVCSFSTADDLRTRRLKAKDGSRECDLYDLSLEKRKWLMEKIDWGVSQSEVNESELAAFVAYAIAFPSNNQSLIDTYDVLRSGVINFLAVTVALHELGYKSIGCRIDSGDLSYLSKEVRARFSKVAKLKPDLDWIENLVIVASNDINEETITSLNEQSHEIDAFGVGTHLVTCQKQPALGCVYKLVTISGQPKIKLSQEMTKITIPGRKKCFRLYGRSGFSILDLMMLVDEEDPKINTQILCRHPFEESKRAIVVASKIERMQQTFWCDGALAQELPRIEVIKNRVNTSLESIRADHRRSLNPTPYKVSVSEKLYEFLHSLWLQNAPIGQLE